MSITIAAYANVDDAMVVWKPDAPIAGCRGFELKRERTARNPQSGQMETKEEVVQTWVGFENDQAPPGTHRDSTKWPIQKMMWTDYWARRGDQLRYRVIPMVGAAGQLVEYTANASPWSKQVIVGTGLDGATYAYFNRGIVASQWLTRRLADLGAGTSTSKLTKVISMVNDRVRNFLGGELRQKLVDLLADAIAKKTKIYAALYELDDPELEALLLQMGKKANVVLANGSVKKKGEDQNKDARTRLKGKINLFDRMVSPSALAHNKFVVFCDAQGTPVSAWTGSTNWTKTGLCTQMNNGILFVNRKMAGFFKEQWNALKAAKSEFPERLVENNSKAKQLSSDGRSLTLWFTPTSDEQDLEYARGLINGAKSGMVFLMFNPGPAGTLLNTIIERSSPTSPHYDKRLYIHGVVNQDPSTSKTPVVGLFHRGELERENYEAILPAAIDDTLSYWMKELLKLPSAFAMVHSKIIVVDPFGTHPVVMTGSHNLGRKASAVNDDNLVIIENDAELAAQYAVNIMSVYEGYRWRFHRLRSEKAASWTGLKDNDQWQGDYLRGKKVRELEFWLGL